MKLKKSSVEAVAEESKPAAGGAFISARLRNPAEELAAQKPSGKGDLVAGLSALIAVAVMAIVTLLLYVNWNAIKSA